MPSLSVLSAFVEGFVWLVHLLTGYLVGGAILMYVVCVCYLCAVLRGVMGLWQRVW